MSRFHDSMHRSRIEVIMRRILCLLLLTTLAPAWSQAALDSGLPPYAAGQAVSGTLSSVGSDTMNNLLTLWAEAFKRLHPGVSVEIQGAGSSTAPPALVEGTATLGPMSRRMKAGEIEAFEARHGYRPTAIRVAVDALAVFVNKDNPVTGLTLPEVDAMFSVTRRCGAVMDITNWGQLGLTGGWAQRPLQLFGRNSVSGTYGYFKDAALCAGDFKPTVNEQPGSASVVQAVSASLNAVGYSGIGYQTPGIRAVPIARRAGGDYIEATAENAVGGRYPLSRFLYIYVNRKPDTPLPALQAEFLRLVLSAEGQAVVLKDGYIPVPANIAARERAVL
jgi:phosphate transport system substrate-binding protein